MKTLTNFQLITIALCCFYASNVYAAQTNAIPNFVAQFIGGKPSIGKQYFTSFESNNTFKNFYVVPKNYLNTSTNFLSSEKKVSGKSSHKAYMFGSNPIVIDKNTNHRGYPVFEFSRTSLGIIKQSVLIEFYIWTNIQLPEADNVYSDWISFASFTSYNDIYWARTYLINMDNHNQLFLMHVPEQNQAIHDIYQAVNQPLPLRTWVKLSTYIDYTANNKYNSPFIALWQDGVLVSASRFNPRVNVPFYVNLPGQPDCIKSLAVNATSEEAEINCGYNYTGGLAQAHFGLYTPPLLSTGGIYNDDLTVSEILH